MNVGRTTNMNLSIKYFNSLEDPPLSKVCSGIPIYRTTLGLNQIDSMDGELYKIGCTNYTAWLIKKVRFNSN